MLVKISPSCIIFAASRSHIPKNHITLIPFGKARIQLFPGSYGQLFEQTWNFNLGITIDIREDKP